jgi:hypothetical protein
MPKTPTIYSTKATSNVNNPQPLPSSAVIGGYVLLGANMGLSSQGMMCAGMGICEYSATPITDAVSTGMAVTFQLVYVEPLRRHILIMTFNLSALQVNQPWQYAPFYDIMNGVSADGTPVRPLYSFDVPYALADPNFSFLGIPMDTIISIPGNGDGNPSNNFDVFITGDVVTIWLTLIDSNGNPW